MDDSDVAGPILFFFVFGTSLLVCCSYLDSGVVTKRIQLSGKLHFGYIYGGLSYQSALGPY